MKSWLACLVGALLLAAPVKAQDAPTVDPSVWQGDATGTIVHRASNVSFPGEIEGFRRTQAHAFASDDVALQYETAQGPMRALVSVYLFRSGRSSQHSRRGSLLAFAQQSPDSFVWSSGPFNVAGAQPLRGYKGTFKTGLGPSSLMDYLYLLELGTWTVKVRATLSGFSEVGHEGRIDALVRALPWSQILAANGACSGSACSSAAFETIEHHFMQTIVGPVLFSEDRYDTRPEERLPIVYRAEIPRRGEVEIRRSEQAPLVYVTNVPGLATYRLFRFPEPANQVITETFGSLSIDKPLFGVEVRVDGRSHMPRLFVGEPTVEAFASAVSELAVNGMPASFLSVAALSRSLPE